MAAFFSPGRVPLRGTAHAGQCTEAPRHFSGAASFEIGERLGRGSRGSGRGCGAAGRAGRGQGGGQGPLAGGDDGRPGRRRAAGGQGGGLRGAGKAGIRDGAVACFGLTGISLKTRGGPAGLLEKGCWLDAPPPGE